MKRLNFITFLAVSVLVLCSCATTSEKQTNLEKDVIYQINPLDALMQGYYDGNVTIGEYKSYGDFGIGTFNGVNGELIELDGVVYQALFDGSVAVPADDEKIPFAATTAFKVTSSQEYSDVQSFEDLSNRLNEVINSQGKNSYFAIKAHGTFSSIKVRSELSQHKPYRNLAEALKTDQREFVYENLPGTLVIMYNPDFMGKINTHGLHIHFISDDKTKGGHVLALASDKLSCDFDKIDGFNLICSDDKEFNELNFAQDMTQVTKYAEFNK